MKEGIAEWGHRKRGLRWLPRTTAYVCSDRRLLFPLGWIGSYISERKIRAFPYEVVPNVCSRTRTVPDILFHQVFLESKAKIRGINHALSWFPAASGSFSLIGKKETQDFAELFLRQLGDVTRTRGGLAS